MKRSTNSRQTGGRRRYPALAMLAVCCLGLGGCGLSEYEEKLTREQRRMEYFVEETKYLDGPVDLPRPREGEEKLPDVFFRPPRGISRTPAEEAGYAPYYTYRKKGLDGLFEFVLVYVSTKDRQEFWTEALRPFAGVGPSDVAPDPTPPQPADGKAIPYEKVTGRGAQENCSIYGYHGNGAHVAIVYCLAPGRTDDGPAQKEKRYSLASLVVGPEAAKRRGYFSSETSKTTTTTKPVP